ncbi:FluC/FEX family fluoride channel [Arthrobacter sp. UM1]|uniref:FluC/FEX family fluoride channel n=1 Tax=Arthrobacter sp. UM1 TaxID=2766776 RepID=UPI001CF6C2A5|nr:CrcB family protein [Arthrobacter sp. UM1]MCB4207187.1 CrcB family protein [Arthrobacter sp. UM1]
MTAPRSAFSPARLSPALLGAVFAGGTAGSLLRWALQLGFPAGGAGAALMTVAANTAGVFAMAALGPVVGRRSPRVQALVNPGFFGGFTTFSAVMLLTLQPVGILVLAVSVAAAWAAAVTGQRLGARFAGREAR